MPEIWALLIRVSASFHVFFPSVVLLTRETYSACRTTRKVNFEKTPIPLLYLHLISVYLLPRIQTLVKNRWQDNLSEGSFRANDYNAKGESKGNFEPYKSDEWCVSDVLLIDKVITKQWARSWDFRQTREFASYNATNNYQGFAY